jgi:heme exporter protein C
MGMISALANPQRFLAFSRWAAPVLAIAALILAAAGLWTGFAVPDDYQQGATVRIMFIHLPAVFTGMMAYGCLAASAFFGLVFRHSLADAAARAVAPLGAAFTFLGLVTGAYWGRPMWGAWWVWDARLTSFLVLFLLYVGYMALLAAIDDETKAARAAGILALVGAINLPIVHYSVVWWNSLHQGETIFAAGGPKASAVYLLPLALMSFAYFAGFGALWMTRVRAGIWRRRAGALAVQGAR